MGTDLDSQWRAMLAGESGVRELTRFPLKDGFPVRVAGEVPDLDRCEYPFLSARKMAHWKSPVFPYSLLVVERALSRAGIRITRDMSPRVATTFSSGIGGLDVVFDAHEKRVLEGRMPRPFVNTNSCINMVAGKISIHTRARGPISATVSACATGSTSMIMGAMLLALGKADLAICGAVDFPVMEIVVAGFASMNGAYRHRKKEPEPPERASRPFSLGRRGFVVSEGAGCVLLATREFARAHGLDWEIELAGWASNSDAHHYVLPHQDTVGRCMAEAIEDAGIRPRDVEAVNAHAASTPRGDAVEARALRDVFGRGIPPLVANKSQFGHAMGASSAVESIYAMHGMSRGVLLPTVNYLPDPELGELPLSGEAVSLEQEHVLKNAFGFGGCNACLVFRRVR